WSGRRRRCRPPAPGPRGPTRGGERRERSGGATWLPPLEAWNGVLGVRYRMRSVDGERGSRCCRAQLHLGSVKGDGGLVEEAGGHEAGGAARPCVVGPGVDANLESLAEVTEREAPKRALRFLEEVRRVA